MGRKKDPRMIVVRETVRETAPAIRELNMPDPMMFVGEWLPARIQRRQMAQRRVIAEYAEFRKWLRLVVWFVGGIVFIGGSLSVYLLMLSLIGTP